MISIFSMGGFQLFLAAAIAVSLSGQSLPRECSQVPYVLPRVRSDERIGADVRQRMVLDSTLPILLPAETQDSIPKAIASMWQEDSVGTQAALAEAVADPTRYGALAAERAAQLYRALGGNSHPMIVLLGLNFDVTRRAMGLGAIRSLVSEEERAIVLIFACDATWQLLPFIRDPAYASYWSRGHFDYWPVLATETIRQAKRLLGGRFPQGLNLLLVKLEESALAPDRPF